MAELNTTFARVDTQLAEYAAKKRVELLPAMIFIGVIITTGIIGNAFTLVYYGFKVKRSPSNFFISTLAVIDLATCIIFSNQIIHLYHFFTFKSVVGCKILYFLNYWFAFSSAFMLVIISIDRYRKLCTPFKRQFTMLSSKVAICTAIVIALLVAIKGNFIVDVQHVNITNTNNETFKGYHCLHTMKAEMRDLVTATYLTDLTIQSIMVVHFVIIYGLITRNMVRLKLIKTDSEISNKRKQTHVDDITETNMDTGEITHDLNIEQLDQSGDVSVSTKKVSILRENNDKNTNPEVRITLLMIIITAIFLIIYVPYFTIALYTNIITNTPVYELKVGYQIVFRFFIINNAVNPYVFLMFNSAYRCYIRQVCKQCMRFK